jgi:hypothetical protein
MAREARTNKTHAAKVFTDDDMEVHKSPLPVLNLEGDDNTDAILRAIAKYKETHNAEQTEQVVHDWYDEYDAMLASNAREAGMYRSLRESNTYNGYDLCQQSTDYEHCEKRRQSELRGQRMDGLKIRQDMERIGRIQQGLMKIRTGLMTMRLNYAWFKVRNGNGIGSF